VHFARVHLPDPLRALSRTQPAQAGSPLLRNGQLAKLEWIEPPEFRRGLQTFENMLLDAVRGPHFDWTEQDSEDIARRLREQRPK
jgi:hypothetical protein